MAENLPSFEQWNEPTKLGEGGQGTVYRVRHADSDSASSQCIQQARSEIRHLIRELQDPEREHSPQAYHSTKELFGAIQRWIELGEKGLGVIKLFKIPEGEPEASKAVKRLETEVEALKSLDHPGILRLLDSNTKRFWMATEYHPRGTLSVPGNRDRFKGKVLESLEAFRPLVDAARVLHDRGHVHRDIKPDNIFVANDGRLVLGDFGIVFYRDGKGERLTETYERVGTRDWMAPWANVPERLESVSNSFDVFPLGKVLWTMISGQRYLPLWYFRRPQYDLERLFPDDPFMQLVKFILAKCVVENESDCCLAKTLLELVDDAISILRVGADVVADDVVRRCRVCGLGRYLVFVNEKVRDSAQQNLGLSLSGGSPPLRAYSCERCGHVQMFRMPTSEGSPGRWVWPVRQKESTS